MRKFLILVILAISTSSISFSAENDLSTLTMEEINKLPAEERNQLPAIEVMKLMGVKEEAIDLLIKLALYKQFYAFPDALPIDEQIRNFQKDHGFEADGILKTAQFEILAKTLNGNMPSRILLSGSGEPTSYGDWAHAQGSWAMADKDIDIGDNLAFRVNESEIECTKQNMRCTEKAYRFDTHDYDQGKIYPKSSYYFYTGEIEYNIIKWGGDEVVAQLVGDCTTRTLSLNFGAKEVTSIARNNGGTCTTLLGQEMPKLDRPEVRVLRDGFQTTYDYFDELDSAVREGWSSEFLKALPTEFMSAEGF